MDAHFSASLEDADPAVHAALHGERRRQERQIELIASENTVSRACLEALGSAIQNKTVEGYPGARFHGGAEFADAVERAAIVRARDLFGAAYANVQPHSGTQANQAALSAMLEPGGRILSMNLRAGGHLSHGAAPNQSGRIYAVAQYGVRADTGLIDYDQVAHLAAEHRPGVLVSGGSAYPRTIDFARMRAIADEVGALHLVDMAHIAGLVAGGAHPSPMPYADVVTCTTTKTLRGARGGLILSNREDLAARLQSAVFPGVQGSIHLQVIAAKAVALHEALQPAFRTYAAKVVEHARGLAAALATRGIAIVTGGTDTHLVLADVAGKGWTGRDAQQALEQAGMTTNANPVPADPAAPSAWTGIRLGSASGTTRGFDANAFRAIGGLIADVLDRTPGGVDEQVAALCGRFPLYDACRDLDGRV